MTHDFGVKIIKIVILACGAAAEEFLRGVQLLVNFQTATETKLPPGRLHGVRKADPAGVCPAKQPISLVRVVQLRSLICNVIDHNPEVCLFCPVLFHTLNQGCKKPQEAVFRQLEPKPPSPIELGSMKGLYDLEQSRLSGFSDSICQSGVELHHQASGIQAGKVNNRLRHQPPSCSEYNVSTNQQLLHIHTCHHQLNRRPQRQVLLATQHQPFFPAAELHQPALFRPAQRHRV